MSGGQSQSRVQLFLNNSPRKKLRSGQIEARESHDGADVNVAGKKSDLAGVMRESAGKRMFVYDNGDGSNTDISYVGSYVSEGRKEDGRYVCRVCVCVCVCVCVYQRLCIYYGIVCVIARLW